MNSNKTLLALALAIGLILATVSGADADEVQLWSRGACGGGFPNLTWFLSNSEERPVKVRLRYTYGESGDVEYRSVRLEPHTREYYVGCSSAHLEIAKISYPAKPK